jgi:hypothetical protein
VSGRNRSRPIEETDHQSTPLVLGPRAGARSHQKREHYAHALTLTDAPWREAEERTRDRTLAANSGFRHNSSELPWPVALADVICFLVVKIVWSRADDEASCHRPSSRIVPRTDGI